MAHGARRLDRACLPGHPGHRPGANVADGVVRQQLPIDLVDDTPPKSLCQTCLVRLGEQIPDETRWQLGGWHALEGVITMSVLWFALAGLSLVLAGIAVRLLWIPPTCGEHSNYDPAFSVLAMAARIVRESAPSPSGERKPTVERHSG
jgi:hypothetical protein